MRLMQRRERHEVLELRDNLVVDQHRRRERQPAVHHAVADGRDKRLWKFPGHRSEDGAQRAAMIGDEAVALERIDDDLSARCHPSRQGADRCQGRRSGRWRYSQAWPAANSANFSDEDPALMVRICADIGLLGSQRNSVVGEGLAGLAPVGVKLRHRAGGEPRPVVVGA